MKSFQIPDFYRSPLISAIKSARKNADKMKKDFTPTRLDFGSLEIFLARHFGFCYGVENAIEIAFSTVNENPGKRIFLLSEMIHNPQVNADLQKNGVSFIMDTKGRILTPWEELNADDIVIIPAFGTTLETEQKLRLIGIDPLKYNTTCPFVEKVWNRSEQIGTKGHTIIIHGKPDHEETRATFSHSSVHAPALVIRDMQEAQLLAEYIMQKKSFASFFIDFQGQHSSGFNPELHLQFIGVVNQTTMLASETQGIADYLKGVIIQQFGDAESHFADTRDTLCYATNDNQSAVQGMLSTEADLAIVVGGYNSSNTSHLVELCEKKLPTYYIENQDNISAEGSIRHYDFHKNQEKHTKDFLPQSDKTRILISSGASCPDAIVEKVIQKLQGFYPNSRSISELIEQFQ